MRRWNVFTAWLFAVCLLAGCGNSDIRAEPYLQDLERVLTYRDQVSRYYLEALEAAKAYTDEPTEEALQNAKEVCLSSIAAITDTAAVESALTAEQREAMSEWGMDQADYMTPFLMQAYESGTRLQTLTDVLHYLNQAPLSDEALALTASTSIAFDTLGWQIDLIGINHLLAQVPEDQLKDFKTGFLENLSAFAGDTIQWETDRLILEERSEAVFGQMEDLIGEHAEQIGRLYTSLLDDGKGLGSELEAAGLPADEAAQLESRADQLLEAAASPAG